MYVHTQALMSLQSSQKFAPARSRVAEAHFAGALLSDNNAHCVLTPIVSYISRLDVIKRFKLLHRPSLT